jgi:GAF domain
MKSRTARLTLLILFMVALGVTAYLFRNGESLIDAEAVGLREFETKSQSLSRAVLDVRMAQQAYVASGQGGEFWTSKVSSGVTSIVAALDALKSTATAPDSVTELDTAKGLFETFSQVDRRAREYARTGQNLIASDLIFSDGLELTDGASARIAAALEAEKAARETAIQTLRSRQVFALVAAAAAAVLVIVLLYQSVDEQLAARFPAGHRAAETDESAAVRISAPQHGVIAKPGGASAPAAAEMATEETPPIPQENREDAPATVLPGLAPATESTAADFSGLASLCTDLARVVDTQELPGLLERASSLLDARGIILWIADPDARELNPIMAQGYPAHLLNRLGALPRDAENATAAAFRTSLLQTVKGGGESNGAIAAPLVTASGCVGVMAAEVTNEAEQRDVKLAAAAIMAAQLATLVGPPPAQRSKVEAAGA